MLVQVPLEPGHNFEPQEALTPWPEHKSERAGAAPEQAMMQALRTKQRFRTVVGDVKGTRDFEIKVIEEK